MAALQVTRVWRIVDGYPEVTHDPGEVLGHSERRPKAAVEESRAYGQRGPSTGMSTIPRLASLARNDSRLAVPVGMTADN